MSQAAQILGLWRSRVSGPRGRQTLAVLAVTLSSTVLGFVAVVVLTRSLGVGGYGPYALAWVWIQLLLHPSGLGLETLSVREFSRLRGSETLEASRGFFRRAAQGGLSASLLVVVLTLAVLALVGPAGNSSSADPLRIGLPLLIVVSLLRLVQGTLRGLDHVVIGKVFDSIVRPVLFIALLGGSVLLGGSLAPETAMALHVAATAVALTIASVVLSRRIPPTKGAAYRGPALSAIVRAGFALVTLNVLFVVNTRAGAIMLGALRGAESAGIYTVAARASELVAFPLSTIGVVLGPAIATLWVQQDHRRLQALVTTGARAVFLLSAPIVLLLFTFGDRFLDVFGRGFDQGSTALRLLLVAHLANAATGSVGLIVIMAGHEGAAALAVGAAAVVNISLSALLVPAFGMNGAAMATLVSVALWNLLLVIWLARTTGIHSSVLGVVRRGHR